MQNQIVTCGGMDCTVCSFLGIFQNIFIWLLGIASLVAILSIIIAGVIYIFSVGSKELMVRAKRFSTYSLAGFIIVLASFISINTVYILFGVTNKTSWFQVDCFGGSVRKIIQESAGGLGEKNIGANLSLKILPAGNIFNTIQDPEKATELDVSELSPERLWQDVASLKNGQRINFTISDKPLDENEFSKHTNQEKGFLTTDSGDRAEGTGIEKIVSIVKDAGQIIVSVEGENPQLVGVVPEGEYNDEAKNVFGKIVEILNVKENQNKNYYVYNDRNQEENAGFNPQACTDSRGEIAVFGNECQSRKYVCGEKNVKCSDKEDEIMGCQCPVGSCLKNQRCVKMEQSGDYNNLNDQDGDGVYDIEDRCPNTPKGETINEDKTTNDYGCSCSQLYLNPRTCPQGQCNGSNYLAYPPSGKDTCENGKRIPYSCEPQIQYNTQCQQQTYQNMPNSVPSSNNNQQQNLADLLKQLSGSQSGGGSGGGSGRRGGSGGGTGGGGGGGNGGGGSGTSPDTSGSPGGVADKTPVDPPLTPQEAFEGGNGTSGSPYEMNEKAMEKVFTYNEQTGKIDLDKSWESKLGVAGKDSYVKVPDKEKVMKAVDKKRKEKGQKELTDEQKEKLKNDKDAVKAPKGANVVDKDSNKEQSVDKDSKDDPSKTSDDSLDSDKQLLKARKPGNSNYEPQTAKEKWAAEHGLVKSEDGTFKKINRGATDYFTPDVAEKLKKASDILKDDYGKDLSLTSGFRGGEGINPNSSRHNSGRAADVALSGEPMTQQNKAILETAMSRAGLRVLRWPSIYEWWHFSDDGH